MLVVPDSLSLTTLSRIGRLDLVREVYGTLLVPPAVKRDLERDPYLEQAFTDRWARIARLSPEENQHVNRLLNKTTLGRTEAQCLALAGRKRAILLLSDKEARTIARVRNIGYLGPVGVLLAALGYRTISHLDFRAAFLDLAKVVRPEPAVVAAALSAAR